MAASVHSQGIYPNLHSPNGEGSRVHNTNNVDIETKIAKAQEALREEERYNSSSRDARKMYGDVTPGDTTHQDVTLEYSNHFKHEHRNLPKSFPNQNKYEVWQLSADIVQESFEVNKECIVNKMKTDLEDALDLDKDTPGPLSESKRDLHRAFKMMIADTDQAGKLEEIKQKVMRESQVDEDTCDFVMQMITKLDPADYKTFIEKGEQRDRQADLEYLYTH